MARYLDGRVLKGHTRNFDPKTHAFQLEPQDPSSGGQAVIVPLDQLKAIFFVKDFAGNREYAERKEFVTPAAGRKLEVRFTDGETLVGTSLTYDPARPGFFLFPADRSSNNDKVYVIAGAVESVRTLPLG